MAENSDYDLNNIYTYHDCTDDTVPLFKALRDTGRDMAQTIIDLCPPGRERAVALTKVEEVIMWANAAIARSEGK